MAHPFRTLTTASMLAESKNQKYPESPVSGMPLPWPDEPSGFSQSAVTLKRPSFRQRVCVSGTHGPVTTADWTMTH